MECTCMFLCPRFCSIITFEVLSRERVGEVTGGGTTVQIDGHAVSVARYSTRAGNWDKKISKKLKKTKEELKGGLTKVTALTIMWYLFICVEHCCVIIKSQV